MNQPLYITKRDGSREPLDLDKIHRVITWAAEGLNDVSVKEPSKSKNYELLSKCVETVNREKPDKFERIITAALELISDNEPLRRFVAWVVLPYNGFIIHKLNLFIRTRKRIRRLALDLIELLRVSSKFARAPPINAKSVLNISKFFEHRNFVDFR